MCRETKVEQARLRHMLAIWIAHSSSRLWLLYVERRNGHSSTLVEKMQDMPGVRPPRSTALEG